MKALCLTGIDEVPTYVNPMHVLGWRAAAVSTKTGATARGSVVALTDGPRHVLDTVTEIARLFDDATQGLTLARPALDPSPINGDVLGA